VTPGSAIGETVLDGSLLLAVPVALAAGLVSFLSPCVLPLVPGYLGYVTGLSGVDLEQQRRGRLLAGATLFVAGFTVVYVALGWAAGAVGYALQEHSEVLARVLGVLTVVLGLVYLGVVPLVGGERRLDVRPTAGLAGAPLLGAAFGIGWTACTGPTLAAVQALAGIGGNPGRGALLATAYCLGLGVPFLLVALAYRRALGAIAAVRRHRVLVTRIGGGLLVAVGVLLASGVWSTIMARMQGVVTGFEPVI
jgi:cytochrome c-type biogenesis protein